MPEAAWIINAYHAETMKQAKRKIIPAEKQDMFCTARERLYEHEQLRRATQSGA